MGAIILGAGVVFLLNNFNVLPYSIWNYLLNFWPIILISAGLKVMVGRNFLLRTIINLFVLITVFFIIIESSMAVRADFRFWIKNKYPSFPYLKNILSPYNQHFKLIYQ